MIPQVSIRLHVCKIITAREPSQYGGFAMRNQFKRTPARALKSFAAMLMVLCLIMGTIPMAFAAQSAGDKPGSVVPSETKVYIRTNGTVKFFTGDKAYEGTVVTPAAGEVCQLVSEDWYTLDGQEYYGVYYLSNRYNVLKSEAAALIMTAEALDTYITETLWKQTTFETLRKSMGLVGDVRVHGLQVALKKLGYNVGAIDGSYGKNTHDAVAKFQRAQGLDADGSAGPLTQPVLYALASGSTTRGSAGGSTGGSTGGTAANTGTLRTIAPVNLRERATKSSERLAEIPRNINLSYTDAYTPAGGVTWYQVRYAGLTGWVMGSYVNVTSNTGTSGGSSTTPAPSMGTLRTNVEVNLRKNATKSSARLDEVPAKVALNFTDTYTASNGVTWYQVTYGGQTGWLMGTYITVTSTTSGGSSSGGATSTEPAIGKVTIIKPSTRVRVSPNGDKSGVVLAKGTVVDLLANPVIAGDYSWHKIRTASGLVGYVRGDCAETSIGTGGNGTVVSDKTFIRLPAATILFTEETKPATGGEAVAAGTVLMMYSAQTYMKNEVEYCSVWYKNQKFNAVYNDVKGGVMTASAVSTYMESLLDTTLTDSLKREYDLLGDVYVYALQSALKRLSLYTGNLDGCFGAGTESAVRNFQRANSLTVDSSCGNETWAALKAAIDKLNNPGSSGGSSSATTVAQFFAGATSVQKATWDGDGQSLLKRGKYATILDIETKKIFRVYRWSGGYHADCVPASTDDTKIMCEIVNFTYRDEAPSASHLANIIKYGKDQTTENYAWPDFGGHVYGNDIGAKWDRRAALIREEGSSKIYAVSLYGYPHGFTGDDGFARSVFPNGKKFYEHNNYYGMMCVHFVGSKTHGGNAVDSNHQTNVTKAYDWAKNNGYSEICK